MPRDIQYVKPVILYTITNFHSTLPPRIINEKQKWNTDNTNFLCCSKRLFLFSFFYPTTEKIYVYIYLEYFAYHSPWHSRMTSCPDIKDCHSKASVKSLESFGDICLCACVLVKFPCMCVFAFVFVSLFCAGLPFFIIHVFKISASVSEVSIAQMLVDKQA